MLGRDKKEVCTFIKVKQATKKTVDIVLTQLVIEAERQKSDDIQIQKGIIAA